MIVDHRGEQRMRARDRVEVTREVEIDIVHRNDLRVSAARGASLHTEDGPEAWLPDAERHLLAHSPKRLRQSDGHGALPFSGGRWIRRGDDDQPSTRWTLGDVERDLGFVFPVEVEIVAPKSQLGGDVFD